MRVGYRRVSTGEQCLDRQELDGCQRVFEERVSAGSKERPQLQELLAFVREGDEVQVWSIDRLARDLVDLESIVSELVSKGVSVSFLSEGLSFSAEAEDPFSRLQLHLMGAFAQFERSIIRRRQREGIEKAKVRGVYKGRKRSIDAQRVRALKAEGFGASDIARQLGIGRASVYRVLQD